MKALLHSTHAVGLTLTLASAIPCQGITWTVDGAGGPGSDFTTIVDAEAAASDGDTILVRRGFYSGFSTSKGITLLGEETGFLHVFLTPPSGETYTVRVHDLAAGSAFRMERFEIRSPAGGDLFGSVASVLVEDCGGSVHLEDLDVQVAPEDQGAGVSLIDAANASIQHCDILGRPGISESGTSRCTVGNSIVRGKNVTALLGPVFISPGSGIEIVGNAATTEMRLVQSTVSGGNGGLFGTSGRPAIRLAGTIWISGDASTTVTSGTGGTSVAHAIGASLFGGSGTAFVDPVVTLTGAQGGQAFDPMAVSLTTRDIPWLTASGGGPGDVVSYTLGTTPLNPTFVLLGLPALPTPTPFGEFELDPLAVTPLFVGPQPASGVQTLNLTVPANPLLVGSAFAVQAGVFRAQAAVLELTNSAMFVLY